jgi:hypothetical protein
MDFRIQAILYQIVRFGFDAAIPLTVALTLKYIYNLDGAFLGNFVLSVMFPCIIIMMILDLDAPLTLAYMNTIKYVFKKMGWLNGKREKAIQESLDEIWQ